jgi:hypothetical protein
MMLRPALDMAMLSNPQKSLLKRAQREADLSDSDYREALQTVSGCRSSKDPRLTQDNLDNALKYFEAIYWRKVDQGELQPSCRPGAVFKQRGYWAKKNTRSETSRDRYASTKAMPDISALECALAEFGCGVSYCAAIRERVTHGAQDAASLYRYRAALARTLRAKQKNNFAGQTASLEH